MALSHHGQKANQLEIAEPVSKPKAICVEHRVSQKLRSEEINRVGRGTRQIYPDPLGRETAAVLDILTVRRLRV